MFLFHINSRLGIVSVLLLLAGFVFPVAAHAKTQTISYSPDPITGGSDTISVKVYYSSSSPVDTTLNGLGFRLHYNSSLITYASVSDVLENGYLGSYGPQDDDSNLDGNADTDKYILFTWTDVDGAWTGETAFPKRLFTIKFSNAGGMAASDSTELGFSVTSTHPAYSFATDDYAETTKYLIWQNNTSGSVQWWKLANTGKISSDVEGTGYGPVSSSETLDSSWRFAGSSTLNATNTLFYQNTSTGKVKYWKLDANAQLSESGNVSDNVTVGSSWKAVGVKTLNSTPTIIWQNQGSGKVVYWSLSTAGTLKDETRDSGWGFVSDSVTVNSNWRLASFTTLDETNVLLWQNQSSGGNVYWKLGSDNKLVDAQRGSGWGFVTSLTLNTQWRQVGMLNSNYLIWHGQSAGKIVWWRLGDDAILVSEDRGTGWAFVSDDLTLNSHWSLGAVAALGDNNFLFWQNTANGAAAYWKVDDDIKLQDETRNSGWGFISDTLTMSSAWSLNCITE